MNEIKTKEELLAYIPYLRRMAQGRCRDVSEADDLVSESCLAALAALSRGEVIRYPATWLSRTLFHKHNDHLRRKYRMPTVALEAAASIPEEEENSLDPQQAEQLRREVAYLTEIYRSVMIRYYFRGQSVGKIAADLHIPPGTVKSRLSAGREMMKRRITTMEKTENVAMPMTLHLCFSGRGGRNLEPTSLVEGDLIAQNLLIHAYGKPLTAGELARRIGIPTVYIEPTLEKLARSELMKKTDSGRYVTDFVIYRPQDATVRLKPQLEFVRGHFERIWDIMEEMLAAIRAMPEAEAMPPRVRTKLERHALLRALQNFELYSSGAYESDIYKNKPRPDGGAWTAFGRMFPMGYSSEAYREVEKYSVCGGLRTSDVECAVEGASSLKLHEFDTNLYDSPCRFAVCGIETYFSSIRTLLWCTHRGIEPPAPLPDAMIEAIPRLCELGLFVREAGQLRPDIPILEKEAFGRFLAIVKDAQQALEREIGGDFRAFLAGQMLDVPPHLADIAPPYRLKCSTQCIVMGVIRLAFERGLHLAGAEGCYPPMVLEYSRC